MGPAFCKWLGLACLRSMTKGLELEVVLPGPLEKNVLDINGNIQRLESRVRGINCVSGFALMC